MKTKEDFKQFIEKMRNQLSYLLSSKNVQDKLAESRSSKVIGDRVMVIRPDIAFYEDTFEPVDKYSSIFYKTGIYTGFTDIYEIIYFPEIDKKICVGKDYVIGGPVKDFTKEEIEKIEKMKTFIDENSSYNS